MSTPPIDTPVGSFEVRCRVGQFVMDSDDPDRAPDLVAVGGRVMVEPDLNRPIRVNDETGMRVVDIDPLEFMIDPRTGKLIHPDGDTGVELIDPTDERLDPQGWTYTATVRPDRGRSWTVTFGAPADGGVVDLGSIAPVAPSPGIAANYAQQTVEARDQAESFAVRAETAADEAEGYAPTFVWDGTKLVIDGGTPVDLKGEKGDGSAWADLTGKPATYPSTIPEVDGLQAIIDRLTYDTGWLNIAELIVNGWAAYAYPTILRRVGATCELRSYLSKTDATDDLFLDPIEGFKAGTATSVVGAAYGSVATTTVAFTQNSSGFKLVRSRMPQNQMMLSMIWTTTDPIPTTLPGTPA